MALDRTLQAGKSALRNLWRSRGFGVAAVVTLTVGVGGNLATLSVVDRLLFRAPPGVANGKDIRRVFAQERAVSGSPRIVHAFSFRDVQDFAEVERGDATVAAYEERHNIAFGDSTLRVSAAYVTAEYFNTFGVRPQLGRFFTKEEALEPSSPIGVLSEALWRKAFGGAPDIIGRTIHLAGSPITVIGVVRGPFQGINLEPSDLWLPLSSVRAADFSNREFRSLEVFVRIDGNIHPNTLERRLTSVYRRTRTLVMQGDTTAVVNFAPLAQARGKGLLTPADLRRVDLAKRLAGVALAVSVVSVANIVVLFLVRTVRRRKELAVRIALGAGRYRIALTLLLEGLIVGAVAAVTSTISGAWFGAVLGSLLLPLTVAGPIVDAHGVLLAAVASITLGGLAAVVPIFLGFGVNGGQALRLDEASSDPRGTQLRMVLLASQVSLCVALITVAATFQQSLVRLALANLGVDRQLLITVDASGQLLPEGSVREAMTQIAALPGVKAVANSSSDLAPGTSRGRFALPGERDVPVELTPSYNLVDTGFFHAVETPVLHGRNLTPSDGLSSAAVAVVTESMANTFWHGRSPLGECFVALGDVSRCVRVVGVVGDIRWDLTRPPQPHYYMPLAQYSMKQGHFLTVRLRERAATGTVANIERIAAATLGGVKRPRVARVADRLERQIRLWKAAATLFTMFGLLALIASGAGVYATVAYEMTQRRSELAIRLTLGATLAHLFGVVVKPVLRACGVGVLIGIGLAFIGGRFIASFLFDTAPTNLTALSIAIGTMAITGFVATVAPSWRVTRVSLSSLLRV